jgi:hypothetical protein
VERVFGSDLPSCNRTMPVVPFGGWIKLKEGIVVERWEGPETQEWSNENYGGGVILLITQEKISMSIPFYLSLLLAFLTPFHISFLGCLYSLPC